MLFVREGVLYLAPLHYPRHPARLALIRRPRKGRRYRLVVAGRAICALKRRERSISIVVLGRVAAAASAPFAFAALAPRSSGVLPFAHFVLLLLHGLHDPLQTLGLSHKYGESHVRDLDAVLYLFLGAVRHRHLRRHRARILRSVIARRIAAGAHLRQTPRVASLGAPPANTSAVQAQTPHAAQIRRVGTCHPPRQNGLGHMHPHLFLSFDALLVLCLLLFQEFLLLLAERRRGALLEGVTLPQ
mmetsp:Transcript_23632/g.57014  ORF Transcript_23632/g.57014 Transcript_23632/m.57014 type:complete len:244 (-) Transcript_23632:999-1730(-)